MIVVFENLIQNWEEEYFFILGKSDPPKPLCLICNATIAVPKKFNLERHFVQNHKNMNDKYSLGSKLRSEFIEKKKSSLNSTQTFFKTLSEETKDRASTSYEINLLIAKKKKSYSVGEEIIKESLLIAARNFKDPKITEKFNQISLSRNTVMRRTDEMAENVAEQINENIK